LIAKPISAIEPVRARLVVKSKFCCVPRKAAEGCRSARRWRVCATFVGVAGEKIYSLNGVQNAKRITGRIYRINKF
jgi:hypothetical protein